MTIVQTATYVKDNSTTTIEILPFLKQHNNTSLLLVQSLVLLRSQVLTIAGRHLP